MSTDAQPDLFDAPAKPRRRARARKPKLTPREIEILNKSRHMTGVELVIASALRCKGQPGEGWES